ncbi:MAG: hypothetical protein JF609_05585, partial [Verrucomicrobia bacterium]|nr:hypothetical protein [Verrucomicrobiota bacterium]
MAGAQFSFFTNNGSITITGGSVTNGTVQIPATLTGRPVTTIGTNAFYNDFTVTNLFLPGSVVNIQE